MFSRPWRATSMARSDRSGIAALLDVARRVAEEVEARTSLVALPMSATHSSEDEARMATYDSVITDGPLRLATRKLFKDGHYSEAVGKAYTVVNNTVKNKCKTNHDGSTLMNHAFSENAPMLAITPRKTESEENEHNGYRSIFGGAMLGIRNPHHHEHDLRDEPDAALEMLVMANHLQRVTNRSKRTRRRKVVGIPLPSK